VLHIQFQSCLSNFKLSVKIFYPKRGSGRVNTLWSTLFTQGPLTRHNLSWNRYTGKRDHGFTSPPIELSKPMNVYVKVWAQLWDFCGNFCMVTELRQTEWELESAYWEVGWEKVPQGSDGPAKNHHSDRFWTLLHNQHNLPRHSIPNIPKYC
jgi:hypothetical protein